MEVRDGFSRPVPTDHPSSPPSPVRHYAVGGRPPKTQWRAGEGVYGQAPEQLEVASQFVFDPQRYLVLPLIQNSGFPEKITPAFLQNLDLELAQLNLELRKQLADVPAQRNLVQVEHDLYLLKRMLKQQVTEDVSPIF